MEESSAVLAPPGTEWGAEGAPADRPGLAGVPAGGRDRAGQENDSFSNPRAPVSRNKLQFCLKGMSRGVGGWAVGELGEGVSLVRAASGQVFKVATSEANDRNQPPTSSSRLPCTLSP